MNADKLMPKKLLSAADVHDVKGKPIYLSAVIAGLSQIQVGPEKEWKWALSFEGTERALTLNVTNLDKLKELFGKETDDWVGQPISLVGATAKYAGKTVPAIRIDEPTAGAASIADETSAVDRIPA